MHETIDSGGWRATLVQAGTLPMEGGWLAPAGELPDRGSVPSNVLLLRGRDRTILVDTAAGDRAGEWEGADCDLAGALAGCGVAAAEIDTVLLTHLDFDHCGGVVAAGRPAFPEARVVVSGPAAAWAAQADDAGAAVIREIAAAGLLDTAGWDELAPELWLEDAPGHRIGHAVLRFGDAAYLADAIHHPAHVANPEWDREFDSDPVAALATRRRLLAAAAAAGGPVACSHVAGWGRVQADGSGRRRWRPAA